MGPSWRPYPKPPLSRARVRDCTCTLYVYVVQYTRCAYRRSRPSAAPEHLGSCGRARCPHSATPCNHRATAKLQHHAAVPQAPCCCRTSCARSSSSSATQEDDVRWCARLPGRRQAGVLARRTAAAEPGSEGCCCCRTTCHQKLAQDARPLPDSLGRPGSNGGQQQRQRRGEQQL